MTDLRMLKKVSASLNICNREMLTIGLYKGYCKGKQTFYHRLQTQMVDIFILLDTKKFLSFKN